MSGFYVSGRDLSPARLYEITVYMKDVFMYKATS